MTRAEKRARNRAAWKAFCERREAHRASDRARRERERAEAASAAPRFTCARCGRRFQLRHPIATDRATAPGDDYRGECYVIIGGRPWCQTCARERFRRRPDPWAAIHPDSIS